MENPDKDKTTKEPADLRGPRNNAMKRLSGLLFLISLVPVSAHAHHGFGRFDMNGNIELTGILTDIKFVNPHSYVYFNVALADGSVREMGCEMRAATVLRRSGWSRELFVTGSQITITGRPHRDDPTSCYVETLAIGEARPMERYQQLSENSARQADRPMRRPDGHPNLSGDWAQEQYLIASLPDGGSAGLVPKSMVAAIEAGERNPADAPNPGWGPRPVTLTSSGEAAATVLRNAPPESNPRVTCEITNILFDWVFDGPINRITQNDDQLIMEYGRDLTRTVYMNMDHHPEGLTPSRGGHSTGRWEGDTLVVDTTGFLPGRMAGDVPHSEALHVVERFTLGTDSLNRLVLNRNFAADDALYFKDQYRGADTVLPADAPFAIDQCKELAFEYTTGAGK